MFKDFDPFSWLRLLAEIAALVLSAGTGLMAWQRKQSARHWPMTYGRVETALVLDENNYWFSDLFYSYKVGTDFYSGRFRLSATNEEEADQQVTKWRGQNLTIRYSLRNPQISVLRMEDQPCLPEAELYRR